MIYFAWFLSGFIIGLFVGVGIIILIAEDKAHD